MNFLHRQEMQYAMEVYYAYECLLVHSTKKNNISEENIR